MKRYKNKKTQYGALPKGSIPPGGSASPSGGNGGDGGGGGVVIIDGSPNQVDGQAGNGGYGGGGGAGTGAYDADYTVRGGAGGVGGGGGGGGANQSGSTPAEGGNSLGGGGGGGPSNGLSALGGSDIGNLGGGSGGIGASSFGSGFGGGGGGGGSGLGGAIFVDSGLNFTLQALPGIPTIFNTSNNTSQAGSGGTGGSGGGTDGNEGTALGDSIFLRTGSSLTLMAQNSDDLLTLGEQVSFTDDTAFGGGGTAFVAEVDNELVALNNQSPRKTIYAPPKSTPSQVWAMGFGQFSRQDSQDQTPAFHSNTGGFSVAYDYGNTDQGYIGALAGYAHSSIHEYQSMGNSHLNAGYLSVYGTRYFSDFFIDAAIWGGYMGVDQKRIISFPGFRKTAKSSYHATQLDLHFGTGYDFNINTVTIEPFGFLDWVCEWDPSYKEKGAPPYNMKISSRTSSMLRLETGLNGYKTATYSWGVFIAQAKLSYVYKKPHHIGHLNAAIVGAPGSFVVEAFTAQQSLISPALELFWKTNWNGYGSISYNGEFGSSYTSNQFYVKIGYSF